MTTLTDFQLIQGARRGEARCEEVLYRRYRVPMFRVCLRYAANRQEAEDMLQEGFMRVFADLADYRGDGPLEGWIRKVVVRTALRGLRKRRVFDVLDEQVDIPASYTAEPVDTGLPDDDMRLVNHLLQQLPPGYRTVINLHVIEGYSHEEIAGLLGITAGTSRSQLSKGRNMLRSLLARNSIGVSGE